MSLVAISYLYVGFFMGLLVFFHGFLVVVCCQAGLISHPFLVIPFSKVRGRPFPQRCPPCVHHLVGHIFQSPSLARSDAHNHVVASFLLLALALLSGS